MKKKFLIVLLAVLALFTAAACSETENQEEKIVVTYDYNYAQAVPEAKVLDAGSTVYGETPVRPDDAAGSYTFTGWYESADAAADKRIAEDKKFTADVTVYAGWDLTPNDSRPELTVTFRLAGGSGTAPKPIKFKAGDDVTMPEEEGFSREGHRLGGWSAENSEIVYKPGETVKLTAGAELSAVWNMLYFIDFDLRGQAGTLDPLSGIAGESVSLPVPQTPDGYTFDGWAIADKIYKDKAYVIGSSDVKAYACFAGEYTVLVQYYSDLASDTAEQLRTGDRFTLPQAPEKTDFIFDCFSVNGTRKEPGDKITVGYENVSVTALWIEDNYTVKFLDWDGGLLATVETPNSHDFVKPDLFVEDFPEFVGWDNDFSDLKDGDVVTAQYDRTFSDKSYFTVQKDSNGRWLLYFVTNDNGRLEVQDLVLPPSRLGKQIYGTGNIGQYDIAGGGQPFYGETLRSIYIPASYQAIGSRNFRCSYALERVEFGKDTQLKYIGDGSFYSSGMTEIVIPRSVTAIGDNAFWASKLTSVQFENGSQLKTLYSSAFKECKMASITLPDGLETIGNSCFENAELTNITIPDSVKTIGVSAFYSATALKSVKIGENSKLTVIGILGFANTPITEITLPVGITDIADKTFQNCKQLLRVTVTGALKTIGKEAFGSCIGLSYFNSDTKGTYSLPVSLKEIGVGAFLFNESLATLDFGADTKLEIIGEYAFAGFYPDYKTMGVFPLGLTSVEIPASVISLGNYAFFYNDQLAAINVAAGNAKYFSDKGALYDRENRLLAIPIAFAEQTYDILEGTKEIVADAAPMLVNVLKINFPSSLEIIGDSAFAESSLREVVMNDGVSKMGLMVFQGSALRKINFSRGMTVIPQQTFCDCYDLETFTVNKEIVTIEKFAFLMEAKVTNSARARLAELIFEKGSQLRSVGNSAFEGTGMKSVVIPASVQELTGYEFRLSDVETVTFEEGSLLKEISYGMFHSSNLTSIVLGDSVESIAAYAFTSCKMTAIDLTGIISIGEYAFYSSKLQSVTIPATVKELGGMASKPYGIHIFSECADLAEVNLPEGLLSLGNYTFNECVSLQTIEIPSTVNYIGSSAFSKCTALKKLVLKADAVISVTEGPMGAATSAEILVKANLVEAYKQHEVWKKYAANFKPIKA